MSILLTLFGWPNGIVLGNLIASALWAAPALLHIHWRITKHQRKMEGQANGMADRASGPTNG